LCLIGINNTQGESTMAELYEYTSPQGVVQIRERPVLIVNRDFEQAEPTPEGAAAEADALATLEDDTE